MKIYNTLTRKKEEFVPIEPGKIKMYACGPTVYNYFHIGNARPFVFFDVVRSYFEYKGYEVQYAQNITDIDDKIINLSLAENVSYKAITKKYIDAFQEDTEKLNISKPTFQPRATEFVGQMIKLIKELESKGLAYEKNGDVYFAVNKAENYGELSGRILEDLKAGARVEENLSKNNPFDFTLWKASKPGEPKWKSPWGEGRPGWHTECVVMARNLLGKKIDIHGGGNDLIFPHHENELAQAKGTGGSFVNYWMHNGFINIHGEKMAKSKGNFFTARDILKKYDADTIRHFFLSKHYRSPIDFNEDIMIESSKAVDNFYSILKSSNFLSFIDDEYEFEDGQLQVLHDFEAAMDDDFNTAKALSFLFEAVNKIKGSENVDKKLYCHLLYKLGLVLGFFKNIHDKLAEQNFDHLSEDLIGLIIKLRKKMKENKQYQISDEIRNDLLIMGIQLQDTPQGTIWEIKKDSK